MSRDGWLPPGVTDADIDRAAPGYDEPPFYCATYDGFGMHCSHFGHSQCWECALSDSKENDDVQKDHDEERQDGWAV